MPPVTENEIVSACQTLFGSELKINRAFLSYLQPSGVRSAYRKQAKAIHPDRFSIACSTTQSRQQRLFQDLNQAHQTIQNYLQQKKILRSYPFKTKYSSSRSQQKGRSAHWQTGWKLPRRPLQFGLFLYYLGIITFATLISAITWQRQQRPALGEIAERWGWLNAQEIRQIMTVRGQFQKFGERAEHLGFLNSMQVRTLLFQQRSQQQRIGDFFVEQGFLTPTQKEELLQQLAEHNRTYRKGHSQHYYYFHR